MHLRIDLGMDLGILAWGDEHRRLLVLVEDVRRQGGRCSCVLEQRGDVRRVYHVFRLFRPF